MPSQVRLWCIQPGILPLTAAKNKGYFEQAREPFLQPLLASTSVVAGIQRAPPFQVCLVSIYGLWCLCMHINSF